MLDERLMHLPKEIGRELCGSVDTILWAVELVPETPKPDRCKNPGIPRSGHDPKISKRSVEYRRYSPCKAI